MPNGTRDTGVGTAATMAEPARRPTFLDPGLEERFGQQGFVLPGEPVLTADEVGSLTELWTSLERSRQGMVFDYLNPDRTALRTMTAALAPIWADRLGLVNDYRVVFTTCVAKFPGPGTSMGIHDDRSFVDERRHTGITVWVPLCDVGPERANGSLHVVPGSHQVGQGMAGPNTKPWFGGYESFLQDYSIPVEVAAGQAIIYSNRLLHGSGPNLSDAPRLALVAAAVPVDAPLIQVSAGCDGTRLVHEVDDEFFMRYPPERLRVDFPDGYPVVDVLPDESGPPPIDLLAASLGVPVPRPDAPGCAAPILAARRRARPRSRAVPSTALDLQLTPAARREVHDLLARADARVEATIAHPEATAIGDVSVVVVAEGGHPFDQPWPSRWLDDLARRPGVVGLRLIRLGSASALGPVHSGGTLRRTIAIPVDTPSVRGGVVLADDVVAMEVGRPIDLGHRDDTIWFNEPGGPCAVVLVDLAEGHRWALRTAVSAGTEPAARRVRSRWHEVGLALSAAGPR